MKLSIGLLRGAAAVLLVVTAAVAATHSVPAPQAPETRSTSGEDVAAPVVLYLKVVDEGDPTPGMQQATYDRRRLEKHYVFEVRAASRPAAEGREYVVRCVRARGVLTHPINVRTEWDTDEPLVDGSDVLDFSRKLSFSAPFGVELSVNVDGAGEIGAIGGLDRLQAFAADARKRAKARRSPMSGMGTKEPELRSILEVLFPIGAAPALRPEGASESDPMRSVRARLGVYDEFSPLTAELRLKTTSASGSEASVEGSCAGDAAAARPAVEFRATYSRRDDLPIAVDWRARLEGKRSEFGVSGRTVVGTVRRFSPSLIDAWIASVRSGESLDEAASEMFTLRGRGGDAAERLFALASSDDDAASRAMAALQHLGADAAPLLERLLRTAADETREPAVREAAIFDVREIYRDAARRSRREAFDRPAAESQPVSRPSADLARAVMERSMPALAALLDAEAPAVRAAGAYALGEFGRDARAHLPRILTGLKSDPHRAGLGALAFAAGALEVDDPAFALPLAKLLDVAREADDPAGQNAAWALSVLGAAAVEAVPLIVDALNPSREAELGNLLEALRRIGPQAKAALPRLRELESDAAAAQWIRRTVGAVIKAVDVE